MVFDKAVGRAGRYDELGHVALAGVDEARDDVAAAVELGDGLELSAPEPALFEHAVACLADAAALGVDEVLEDIAVGEADGAQVAERVVVVGGYSVVRGVAAEGEVAIGREGVFDVAERLDAVLGVVRRLEDAGGIQGGEPVAVGVIGIGLDELAVLGDGDEAARGVVCEIPGVDRRRCSRLRV
ncbi:MAG: hypothetical protein U0271_22660 [Polyangiaceae bacterium]